jgi:hypothetical protein
MLSLLSIVAGGKRLFSVALGWFIANPWRISLIAIAVLCAALWLKQGALDSSRETIAAMKQASKDSKAAQVAMNAKRAQDEKDVANDADAKDAVAQIEAGRTAIVYRDRWRVRNICAASQADTATPNSATPNSDGPSDIADMVAVSPDDFDRCTANSVRLQSVNQWGAELIEKGLAVDIPAQ